MSYASQATLQVAVGGSAKLIQLTDDDANGAADAAVVAAVLAEADDVINGYVAKRYAPSDAARSPSIASLAARMAARCARRRRNMALQNDEPDEKLDREWLDGVRTGAIALVDSSGIQITRSELVTDSVGDRENVREVTRSKTRGFW